MSIHILATLESLPEFRTPMYSALRELVHASRQEPGNLRYDLYCETDRPGVFHLVEAYRDMAALEAHRVTQHYLDYRGRAKSWLTEPPVVRILNALDLA
jgi:quinol monooxygenase YgiN